MNLKYRRDIYFLLIAIFLFVFGFVVPKDQRVVKFVSLKKNYENNLKYLKKSKTVSTLINDQQINKLLSMLNEKIEENKTELEKQRQLIGFYNKEQRSMNKESSILSDKLGDYKTKSLVNDKNYTIISNKQKILNNEYYYFLAVLAIVIVVLGFFGYKLYNRIITDVV